MKNRTSFKVGDMLVKLGEVCQITKIEERKNAQGSKEEILHYKPYYTSCQTKDVNYSIPLKNLHLTSIRKPISQKDLLKLLKILSQTIDIDAPVNVIECKETFNANDLPEIAYTLKRIWSEKQEKKTEFSRSKSELYEASMKIIVEEVALLKKSTIPEAQEIIEKALKN